MDLGVIGSVKQDPSIVMRVELPDIEIPKGTLYLRGMGYDHYNGRSWSTHLSARRPLNENPPGTFTVRTSGSHPSRKSSPEIRQNIILEPLDTPVLFGAPGASSITGNLIGVQSDSMGALFLPFPASNRTEYTIRSRSALLDPQEQSAALSPYPEFIRQHYLQLPPLSQQVAELTHRVVKNGHTPNEMIALVKQHLLTTYRYSLDLEVSQSTTPLEDFLFIRKTGYCEHYATAMILMLRSIGIPSRLVTGFLASEWNEFGSYYTVRQRDAHAWVEVYFPRSGWMTFDPTPPVLQGETDTWWQSVEGVVDSVRLRWDRLFIQYSATDQLAVLQGVREGSDALRNTLSESLNFRLGSLIERLRTTSMALGAVNVKQAAFMVVLMMIGLFLLATILQRKPWKNGLEDNRASPHQLFAVRVYGQMTDCLTARGIRKSAYETPAEFVRQVEREWAAGYSCVRDLTDLYCRARFGECALTSADVAVAQQLLRQLRNLE
jgi:transglutaminase-like putative cysteine protease